MAHVNNSADPRGNVRFEAYTGDIEKKKNSGKEVRKLLGNIDVSKQTPNDAKKAVAEILQKAKKKPKKQSELGKEYEALPYAAFSDFDDVLDKNGNLNPANPWAAQYIKNFGIDDPNYEVEIGEYEDGYTVYLKTNKKKKT